VTGHVADIRPYIQHARVVVAPLQIARGIQNKVLEAMAMGKTVVATQAATRALAVTSGIELWIEDDPKRFATAVAGALNGADRLCIAQNGHRYVEAHHNWTRNLTAIDEILAQLGQPRLPPSARLGGADEKLQDDRNTSLAAQPPSLAGAC
jgi:glycosyltransferase involved in cell wall biosynthesis